MESKMNQSAVCPSNKQLPKFSAGQAARENWTKPLPEEKMTVGAFNAACGGVFKHACDVVLDPSDSRQTTITYELPRVSGAKDRWSADAEQIYLIVRDGAIMKIGGTRTGMKARFGSYLCGHCVPERLKRSGEAFPGKMSVTNAHLYHTIESDLLAGDVTWSFYIWKLPETTLEVEILGEKTTVVAQTYHAYESRCMWKFSEMTGHIPLLSVNSDPSYR
jgi:hypothetical protein